MKKGVKDPKYSLKEVSQKFNLKELLGYGPSEDQKELFFALAVDKMQERTTNGKDINGKKFTKYSKAYAQQKGVSRSAVDLVLTGDMLESYEESKTNQVNIVKIKVGDSEVKKSYNHNVGDTLPVRTHFGIVKDDEMSEIINAVDSIKPQKEEKQTEPLFDLAALRRAIGNVTLEQEDG